jgi:hypothetical protein
VCTDPNAVIRITAVEGCRDFAVRSTSSPSLAHLQIAQDDVVLALVELLYRDVPIRRLVDLMPRIGQRADDAAAKGIVIICDQDTAHSVPLFD